MEYDLSCVNTIVARCSCCDDDWVDVSIKRFETILDQIRHIVCVCVLWKLMKLGTGPLALIISTSEKQWITHTHKLPKPPCPPRCFPFLWNYVYKNNYWHLSSKNIPRHIVSAHQSKPKLRSEWTGRGAGKHRGSYRNSVNPSWGRGANSEREFLRV